MLINACCPLTNNSGIKVGGSAIVTFSDSSVLQNFSQWISLIPTTIIDVTTYNDLTDNHFDGVAYGDNLPNEIVGMMCDTTTEFDGRNWIELESDSVTGSFSVSIWVAPYDYAENRTILDRGNFRLGYNFYSGFFAELTLDDGTIVEAESTTTYETETFYHVACSFDGEKLKIFVNGVEEDSQTVDGTPIALASVSTLASPQDTTKKGIKGVLQQLRISNIARDADFFLAEYENACGSLYTL